MCSTAAKIPAGDRTYKRCDRTSLYITLKQRNPTSFFTHNFIHLYHCNVMIGRIAISYGTLRDRTTKRRAIALLPAYLIDSQQPRHI